MRKLIVSEFVSLDGVMQGPGGADEDRDGGFAHGGWTMPYWHDDMGARFASVMKDVDALLLGRRTYVTHAEAFEPMAPGDPFGRGEIDLEGFQIAVVDADEAGVAAEGAFEFALVMNFHQRGQPRGVGKGVKMRELVITQDCDDQEDRVGAQGGHDRRAPAVLEGAEGELPLAGRGPKALGVGDDGGDECGHRVGVEPGPGLVDGESVAAHHHHRTAARPGSSP